MHPLERLKNYLLQKPALGVMVNRCAGLAAFTLVLVTLVQLFAPAPSQATLPVIDPAAIGQLIQQTQQFTQHLAMMADQIRLIKQHIATVTGHYGMGKLTEPVTTWGKSNWEDLSTMVRSGVNPGDSAQVARYKAIRDQYLATYPPLAEPLRPVLPRLEDVRKANYQAGIMGLSSSRSIYNALNDQLKDLQSLKDAIDKTPTLKAAVDLNTAVGLKNAQINAELLRTQAIGVYIQANSQASENNAQSAQAEFFQR